jgi:membrane peptidoglycan carboxypeptidase
MKNFFFGKWWRIAFIFAPLILIFLIGITGIIGASVFYNQYNDVYEKDWKEKLLSRVQTFYLQIQQTLSKDTNKLPVSYVEDTQDVRPTVAIPSVVYDKDGNKIGYYGSERRDYISLNDMSRYFIYSLLASEDRRFFSHFGVDLKRTIGVAFYITVLKDTSRGGGSSITQQLSRYLMDWNEPTIERKAVEILGAIDLERNYSKKQILEMYCNFVPFSHGAYGVENAAQTFFDKSARDLTIGESALLVGVIPNPNKFSPFKSDPDKLQVAKDRHKRVLYSIVETGFLPEMDTIEEANRIYDEFWEDYDFDKINRIASFSIRFEPSVAYVGEQVRKELIEYDEKFEKILLEGGGLNIFTTINTDYERIAQEILKEEIELYRQDIRQNKKDRFIKKIKKWKKLTNQDAEKEITDKEFEKTLQGIQGALVLLDNETGEIVTFIGGDGFTSENQYIRTHQSKRQPGSSFKPVLYYSVLDTKKVSMYSMYDAPGVIEISFQGGKKWVVKNFGGRNFERNIPLTEALYRSVNTVAAKLINLLGVTPIRENLKNVLELSEEEAMERFPNGRLSLALGTADMSPLEMSRVYSTFARLGKGVKPYLISKVYDHRGELLIDNEKDAKRFNEKQVLTRESVYILTRMMHKVFGAGGTAGGIRKLRYVPEVVDIKTFDDILDSFYVDSKGVNKNKDYILKYYDKDEENKKYILKDTVTNSVKRTIKSKLETLRYNKDLKGWYIGKTGTTQSNTNAWLCGASKKYTLIVWVGHDNNLELFRTGADSAGPIWGKLMSEIEKAEYQVKDRKYILSETQITSDNISIYNYPYNKYEDGIMPPIASGGYTLIRIPVSRETGKIPVPSITPKNKIDYYAVFYKDTEPGLFDKKSDYPDLYEDELEDEDIENYFTDDEEDEINISDLLGDDDDTSTTRTVDISSIIDEEGLFDETDEDNADDDDEEGLSRPPVLEGSDDESEVTDEDISELLNNESDDDENKEEDDPLSYEEIDPDSDDEKTENKDEDDEEGDNLDNIINDIINSKEGEGSEEENSFINKNEDGSISIKLDDLLNGNFEQRFNIDDESNDDDDDDDDDDSSSE